MARKNGKKLSLETAEQADGALPTIRSAYALMGIQDVRYRETTFASYQAKLRGMDLVELHDEAYDVGVSCNPSHPEMVRRLEEKYLRDHPDQRDALAVARAKEGRRKLTVAEQAERIMAEGR